MEFSLILSAFGMLVILAVILYFRNIYLLITNKSDNIILIIARIAGIAIPMFGIFMGVFSNGK